MLIDPFSKTLLNGNSSNKPISLMYHSVVSDKLQLESPWSVSLHQFKQQLDLLQTYGWTTVCAQQLTLPFNQLPKKTAVITFDDGYADNFSAFKELEKRNMTASWFVVTNDIGKTSSWSDIDTQPAKLLTTEQLLEMQNAGMEIGSHTLSHCRLTQVPIEQINNELIQARSYLSSLLSKPVNSFAYPYGLYNSSVLSATKNAGYNIAFTTRTGFGLVNNNPLEIRRISIMAGDSLSTFARKLVFADNDVSWKKISRYSLSRIKARIGL